MLELTQKSERTIQHLETKIASLEKEVATHNASVDELNREHNNQLETLRTDNAVLEVCTCTHIYMYVYVQCVVQLIEVLYDIADF